MSFAGLDEMSVQGIHQRDVAAGRAGGAQFPYGPLDHRK